MVLRHSHTAVLLARTWDPRPRTRDVKAKCTKKKAKPNNNHKIYMSIQRQTPTTPKVCLTFCIGRLKLCLYTQAFNGLKRQGEGLRSLRHGQAQRSYRYACCTPVSTSDRRAAPHARPTPEINAARFNYLRPSSAGMIQYNRFRIGGLAIRYRYFEYRKSGCIPTWFSLG